jgi:hypothetical protein
MPASQVTTYFTSSLLCNCLNQSINDNITGDQLVRVAGTWQLGELPVSAPQSYTKSTSK